MQFRCFCSTNVFWLCRPAISKKISTIRKEPNSKQKAEQKTIKITIFYTSCLNLTFISRRACPTSSTSRSSARARSARYFHFINYLINKNLIWINKKVMLVSEKKTKEFHAMKVLKKHVVVNKVGQYVYISMYFN